MAAEADGGGWRAERDCFRSWRADGSPRMVASFEDGKQVGAAWTFHPDGCLFSLGCFAAGEARGVHRRYASGDPQGERLQPCCVPPGAWQLRQDYSRPGTIDRGWFTRDGQRLLESGAPYPEHPPTVPADAWYNEALEAWETSLVQEEDGLTGTRRRWSTAGRPADGGGVGAKQTARPVRNRSTRAAGWCGKPVMSTVSSAGLFTRHGCHGGHFADPRVCRQTGSFEGDQAVGVWQGMDGAGEIVHERDLGPPLDATALMASPVWVNRRRGAEEWRQLAAVLFAKGRVSEGLVAAARAASESLDPTALSEALDTWALPLGKDAAVGEAQGGLERAGESSVMLLDSLKRGGDAPTLLWSAAKLLSNQDRLALDLVSAALLLAPATSGPLATRALLHGGLGGLAAARADVTHLMALSPEQGEFLDLYLRAYFPAFTFWPGFESFDATAADVPLQAERTPTEVREVIQRYATRLGLLREALCRRLTETDPGAEDPRTRPFMIPDLSGLLPAGPLGLSRWTFEMSAEEYGGSEDGAEAGEGEQVQIVVDENPRSGCVRRAGDFAAGARGLEWLDLALLGGGVEGGGDCQSAWRRPRRSAERRS